MSPSTTTPLDFSSAIQKKYTVVPVPKTFIPSLVPRAPSSGAETSNGTGQLKAKPKPKQQILWVGCSDSVISETETLALDPDEMLVLRNLGNRVSNGDLSSASAVEWAVEVLEVGHIIVCGHYDCGLIKQEKEHGWYKDITHLHTLHNQQLSLSSALQTAYPDEESRARRLEEIYVLAEVEWLRKQENVRRAVEGRGLRVHGFVFERGRGMGWRLVEEGQS